MPKEEQGFPQGFMKLDHAIDILRYCAKNGTTTMKPFWRGEATINKDLPKVLEVSKELGISTMMNTNGTFPLGNEHEVARHLDWISFSLDEFHQNNIADADILKRVLLFKYLGVRTEVQSATPTDEIIEFCNSNDIKFISDSVTKRTDSGDYEFLKLSDYKRKNCKFPFWRMIISWDLKIKPCCVSWRDDELTMGRLDDGPMLKYGRLDLYKMSDVWNGEA